MKKTTFVNSHPVGEMKTVKFFAFAVMCLVAFLFAGAQSAQAQLMVDVSEDIANQTVQTIQAEMDALEVDAKNQPANMETDFELINYYQNAIMGWRKGGEFKTVLINGASSIQGGNGNNKVISPDPRGGDSIINDAADLKTFNGLVELVDLNDGGSSLQAVIDYLRTLKNQ